MGCWLTLALFVDGLVAVSILSTQLLKKQTRVQDPKDMNQSPQFSHLLYSSSWTLMQIGRDRQRSVALVGNIHQGEDPLESTFKLLS